MQIGNIPFGTTDWSAIEPTTHMGDAGVRPGAPASSATSACGLVEYSPGYLADHWCQKGHILFCVDGELGTDLADGRSFTLTPGMSYQVADGAEPHRSHTAKGARPSSWIELIDERSSQHPRRDDRRRAARQRHRPFGRLRRTDDRGAGGATSSRS